MAFDGVFAHDSRMFLGIDVAAHYHRTHKVLLTQRHSAELVSRTLARRAEELDLWPGDGASLSVDSLFEDQLGQDSSHQRASLDGSCFLMKAN